MNLIFPRLYAGIHYRVSVEAGVVWGREIADNILAKLKFNRVEFYPK